VLVLCVRTKANFLFRIRVCGRCMCYTRKGMLRDSYIFKSFGFVLFLHIFHMCFTALLLFTVGYCSFSFMYIYIFFFNFISFHSSCFFFLVWLFRNVALDASLRWTKLVPISMRELSGSNLAQYADYPDKETLSTVLVGKCRDRTLSFAVISSSLVPFNSLYTIIQ
jgi:hypothetical protein